MEAKTQYGVNALSLATIKPASPGRRSFLIEAGVNVSAARDTGLTVLHVAAVLLTGGADTKCRDIHKS